MKISLKKIYEYYVCNLSFTTLLESKVHFLPTISYINILYRNQYFSSPRGKKWNFTGIFLFIPYNKIHPTVFHPFIVFPYEVISMSTVWQAWWTFLASSLHRSNLFASSSSLVLWDSLFRASVCPCCSARAFCNCDFSLTRSLTVCVSSRNCFSWVAICRVNSSKICEIRVFNSFASPRASFN